MSILNKFAKAFLAAGLLVGGVASADMATQDWWYSYSNVGATFGCATHHNYAVTLTNYSLEPQSCNVSCRSNFHNESQTVLVYPRGNTVVNGSFGMTLTVCNVVCNGNHSGRSQAFSVSGNCA